MAFDEFKSTWLSILQANGADVAGAEGEIVRLERSLHLRRYDERNINYIAIPDDIKRRIGGGDRVILASMCRGRMGRARTYMDGTCYTVHDKHPVHRDAFRYRPYEFTQQKLQDVLGNLTKNIGFGYGKTQRKSRAALANAGLQVLPITEHGVCLKCGQRDQIGELIPHETLFKGFDTADEFWDTIRPLIGIPFERFATSDEMPEHGCEFEYERLLREAKDLLKSTRVSRRNRKDRELSESLKFDEEDIQLKEDVPSYVYLMRNNRNGYHKIGRSKMPTIRERTLAAEDPDIQLVWSIPAYSRDEEALHECFRVKRLRGEWFDLSPDEVQWLVSLRHRREIYLRDDGSLRADLQHFLFRESQDDGETG